VRRESAIGGAYAAGAFTWWGLAPVYWRAVEAVPGVEMIAHRVVWALPLLLLLAARRRRVREVVLAIRDRAHRNLLLVSGSLLAVNWLVFIEAVRHGRVLEASLGYFVNPLVNVLLGMMFLGERLTRAQWLAVALAATGVAWLTVSVGSVPWLALALAGTFGVYGLLRKRAGVDSLVGLSVETLLLAPAAIAWIVVLLAVGRSAVPALDGPALALVAAVGAITAVPLLWFADAARRLRYATLGFFQYLAPTGQLLVAVFLFGEPFSRAHAVAFGFIWVAVGVYLVDTLRAMRAAPATPSPLAPPGEP
jgi:chloramphenicol-sensitive protein RarD